MFWSVNPLFAQGVEKLPAGIPVYLHLLVALGVILVSFLLGGYLGKKLRMPSHGWKISLILFSILASVAILLMGPPLKLGIDLKGGVILIYEVDQTQKRTDQTVNMDELIDAVKRRVNPGGQKEVTIRKYGLEQIEVIVPEIDEAEVARIERIITTTGNLQFRILANNRDNKDLIERALADDKQTKYLDASGKLAAWWTPVKPGEESSISSYSEIALRKKMKGEREITEVLVLADDYNVTGAYLVDARPGTDRQGRYSVNFTFDDAGGQRFGDLTGSHLPDEQTGFTYKLAIILDDALYSAPQLNDRIYRHGEISGNFTKQEVQDLVNVLKAGSLPAALAKEPISKLYSGPTLGQDTIDKGKKAMIISSILVLLFMLWYYRISGIVADLALLMNILILFAIMISVKAAFTLTGFAGLALTVGMAVDNNVLVFERLREELQRGAALRMAIRNAFQRASNTIVDSNLTTLIAAAVMYVIGSDQMKGFAVPLFIGVILSMYTSVFVARVIFDIAEKRRWITEVKMLRLLGHTEIDFIRAFPYALTFSIVITVMAVVFSLHRGTGLLDIDFTGGVSVQVIFNQPEETDNVREALRDRLPDLTISDAYLQGEQRGLRFMINTSELDIDKVKRELSQVFGGKLARNALDFSPPAVISAVAPALPKPDAAPGAKPSEPDAPPEKPADAGQTRLDLPPRTMLAFAGGDQLALLLADDPKAPPAAKPAAPPAAEAAPPPADAPKSPARAGATAGLPGSDAPNTSPRTAGQAGSGTRPLPPDPFAGGVQTQLKFAEPVNHQAVEQCLAAALEKAGLSPETVNYEISNDRYTEGESAKYAEWTLKIKLPKEQAAALLADMKTTMADEPLFPASSQIGKTVADKTQLLAIGALTASWLCMIIYLWVRFQGVAFGLAAVVALIHDVFVMLGAVAVSIYLAPYFGFLLIEPLKINLITVAAFLTIIGFSANDTIVIFDRIREIRGKSPYITRDMVNLSTNQCLSRTLLTSFTVLIVVVIIYIFGGEAIHGFAFTLLVGVLTGIYSTVYVASPFLLWLVGKREPAKIKPPRADADLRQTDFPSRRA